MKNSFDRILDNLERLLGGLLLSLIGMVSYLFVNSDKLSAFKFGLLLFCIATFIVAAILTAITYFHYFNEVREMEKKKE
ncbi:hypothetical protein DCO58_00875 [Helicobacter saguini]|uniref:Uncharacterized protein n=1 Tax=Helicobacter saguini TaxID=1548018 RepID=A0A347VR28_9HELI|nr:hypothetical protein [Helicobacter saguini]MWV63058.1 hypothetical protein [Helicobacter saguini]MWV66273.1 hypothetical protein [Helicobacter saguini]MWV68625.1 hypothetical protein [Helicobacter saguini]MWV71824.1 hypothetical protein [Helicobacter saguini]TLD95848.1 hypothetical protein LS64_000300 [Helicobacter saguini]